LAILRFLLESEDDEEEESEDTLNLGSETVEDVYNEMEALHANGVNDIN
jgi:hypothetical protein